MAITFALRSAMVGKSIEHCRGRGRSLLRRWRRIEPVAVYGARAGLISILPHRSMSGNGTGLAVGGFGRGRHRCESRRLLSGRSSDVVKFPARPCFRGDGRSWFSVPSVLALDTFRHKAACTLTPAVTGKASRQWNVKSGNPLIDAVRMKRVFDHLAALRGNDHIANVNHMLRLA